MLEFAARTLLAAPPSGTMHDAMEETARSVRLARPGLVFFTGLGLFWGFVNVVVVAAALVRLMRGADLSTAEVTLSSFISFEQSFRPNGSSVIKLALTNLSFVLGDPADPVFSLSGLSGYFLITQDFINHGRSVGVAVGPGRGSAAGSAVAYCVGITNIDPIKYSLLFERSFHALSSCRRRLAPEIACGTSP